MSSIALRNAIVASLDTELGEGVDVKPWDGRFDEDEVARHLGHRPTSIRVAVTGHGDTESDSGPPIVPARVLVMIVTKPTPATADNPVTTAGDHAATLADKVLAIASDPSVYHWDCAAEKAPERFESRNLYTPAQSKRGFCLWLVAWQQAIELTERVDEDLNRLREIHTEWVLEDADDNLPERTVTPLEDA